MSQELTVERLSVDRGGRAVLRDLSFTLSAGSAIVVTGSNGAGKSTLLRAIAGFIPLLGGTVALNLSELRSGSLPRTGTVTNLELQESISYLGHGNGLKMSLTAAENLRFILGWAGDGGLSPHEALAAVDLPHVADFPVRILSAGQRRRVALAGLLAARRPLWLLDEPATALDATSEAMLGSLLRSHLERGGLVLAAIHSPLDLPARELHLSAA